MGLKPAPQGEAGDHATAPRPGGRWGLRALFVIATLLIVGPAFDLPAGDGFPLSNYPMFAADRGPSLELHSVQGVTAGGGLVPLSPRLIAQSPSPNLALVTARRAVRRGPAAMQGLCAQVARRVAQDPAQAQALTGVALVRLQIDLRARFASAEGDAGAATHTHAKRLAECGIGAP